MNGDGSYNPRNMISGMVDFVSDWVYHGLSMFILQKNTKPTGSCAGQGQSPWSITRGQDQSGFHTTRPAMVDTPSPNGLWWFQAQNRFGVVPSKDGL